MGAHDGRRPLLIDPGLTYSTYLGGSTGEQAFGIAVDGAGSVYVAGDTHGQDFPTTVGSFDTSKDGFHDAFITKLSPDGSNLLYSTFLGGTSEDRGFDIAVDADGSAYITGDTTGGFTSNDFPTTPGAFDTSSSGGTDSFVTKLSPDGSSLAYSTYFGGPGGDTGFGIAVDIQGLAYIVVASSDAPTTPGAFRPVCDSNDDTVVAKLTESGADLAYSTCLSSASYSSQDIAVDLEGNAYVTGEEVFEDVPVTPGAFDVDGPGQFEPGDDAFVVKLTSDGSNVAYGTYLGGSGDDRGFSIAVDDTGSAYVTGDTESEDFPVTPGAYDMTYNGGLGDVFVTKLNPSGSALAYSTLIGGSYFDGGYNTAITIDNGGSAYVTGGTVSGDFPTTLGAYDSLYNGGFDVFVARLDETGSTLAHSTYLGGSSDDFASTIAVDGRADAYVAGGTESANFPTTPGAYDTTFGGGGGAPPGDAFVAKLGPGVQPPGAPATLVLSPKTATNTVDSEHCVTATVTDATGSSTANIAVVLRVTLTNRAGGTRTTDPSGQATFCYTGELLGTDRITAFADSNPENQARDVGEPGDTATKQWLVPASDLCRGSASNNGRILARNGDRASFRGEASASGSSVRGRERYQDRGPAEALTASSSELQAITCSADGSRASIFGRASIDGSGSFAFRIDVFDGGPGKRGDSYRILLQTGYDSGVRTLRAGDVRVRLR